MAQQGKCARKKNFKAQQGTISAHEKKIKPQQGTEYGSAAGLQHLGGVRPTALGCTINRKGVGVLPAVCTPLQYAQNHEIYINSNEILKLRYMRPA